MTEPTFGISFLRDNNEPRPAIESDMSIVGLIGPMVDASNTVPLNDPIVFNSDDVTVLATLGQDNLIVDAINAINDQLAEFQRAARIVLVRTTYDIDADIAIGHIVGDSTAGTGVHAFLKAGQKLGAIPRLIAAPGYTSRFSREAATTGVSRTTKGGGNTGAGTMTLGSPAYLSGIQAGVYTVRCTGGARSASVAAKQGGNTGNGVLGTLTADATAAIGAWRIICQLAATNGGSFVVLDPDGSVDGIAVVGSAYNSAAGPNFTIADGSTDFVIGDEFVVTVAAAVPANGGVFSVQKPDGTYGPDATVGVAYATEIAFTIADSNPDFAIGDGFDVTVTLSGGNAVANPVVAALPGVLNKLIGVAVCGGPADTYQNFVDWRETIQSDRIIPLASTVKVALSNGTIVEMPAEGRILGIAVRRDFEKNGRPFHSWANQPVQGIVAPNRFVDFSLTDGATEGQELLAANGGVILRGQVGVETAIASGGFVYVGTDTCSEDTLWQFYNVMRGRDYIHLMFLRTLRYYLGRFNITGQTIQSVLNTMEFALRDLKADQDILGYEVGFTKDQNSPENLRLGKFTIRFAAEEPPVLRRIVIQSARYRDALDTMLDELLTQLELAA